MHSIAVSVGTQPLDLLPSLSTAIMIILNHHRVLIFIILLLLTLAAADNEVCSEDYNDAPMGNSNNFYAWSTAHDVNYPLLNALFPNLGRFQTAWETHPLLSRVSFQQEQDTQPLDDNQIPIIQHNRQLISQLKLINNQHQDEDLILSLLSVDDTAQILSQSDMTHGNEYKLLKKIIIQDGPEKGEEYNGMLPGTQYSLQEILQHFHYGAFSVVINKMERRWRSIANFARQLEHELGAVEVNVNLYMTPEVVSEKDRTNEDKKNGNIREGFEAHWDWMDVIIVQLSGMKRWSVAREASIYLSNKDQKRKPTLEELKRVQRYDDFTLCPGDILYIPRGYLHNASTIDFEHLQESDEVKGQIDLDSCPLYPNGVLDRRVGPSLHLTFGLLESNDATIETLLHYALDAYYESSDNSMNEIAVSATTCSKLNSYGVTVDHDIRWSSVFHHIIAEVARREHTCDNILSSNQRSSSIDINCNEGNTILRKSVPLMLDDTSSDNESSEQYLNLKQTYLSGLDILVSSANLTKTATFIQTHLLKPPPDDDALIFHYPSYSEQDVIICPNALNELPGDDFIHKMKSFIQYASEKFDEAYASLNNWGKQRRQDDRQQQRISLDTVGQ